ncbi:MAG: HIT family protein [Sphingomicrobium sp.]
MKVGVILTAFALAGCAAPRTALTPDGAWDPDNVFAQIQAGREPAAIVYQDAELLVIMDHAPVSSGHALVLSKTAHARDIIDVPPATLARMMAMARRLVVAERVGLGADGSSVIINSGSVQTVHSLHVHVIPTYAGKPIDWSARAAIQSQPELEAVAVKLRAALAAQR